MIRSFEIRDFPALHRNRHNGLYLDTAIAMTRSLTLVPAGALLATLAPATGIFTFVATNEGNQAPRIVGQFMHLTENPNAKLVFITPETAIDSPEAPALLDHLAAMAGKRGAHQMLAEVDERSIAYEVLRKAGYVIYTRQRVWQLEKNLDQEAQMWRPVEEADLPEVYHLYHALVPALVQQTEPLPWEHLNGLVYIQNGEILAYVHLENGPKGIYAQPFILPEIEPVETLLASLANAMPAMRSKKAYLSVRSHQAWLAPFLDELGFTSTPRQAVMVKRMAVRKKLKSPLSVPVAIKSAQPEITSSRMLRTKVQRIEPIYEKAKNY